MLRNMIEDGNGQYQWVEMFRTHGIHHHEEGLIKNRVTETNVLTPYHVPMPVFSCRKAWNKRST